MGAKNRAHRCHIYSYVFPAFFFSLFILEDNGGLFSWVRNRLPSVGTAATALIISVKILATNSFFLTKRKAWTTTFQEKVLNDSLIDDPNSMMIMGMVC